MADTLVQALIMYLEQNGYPDPTDESQRVRIMLGLDNGIVLKGTIVSPRRFYEENSDRSQGGTWPPLPKDPDDPNSPGFSVPLTMEPSAKYVHLTHVEYLAGVGEGWAKGSTARVDTERIILTGEKS